MKREAPLSTVILYHFSPDTRFEGLGVNTTKIDKLFSFCIFTLVFCIESKKLKEIFRRYEIDNIELTDDAVNTINEYWKNLIEAKHVPFTDISSFGEYMENLIYVTAKVNTDGINSDNVYNSILLFARTTYMTLETIWSLLLIII